MPESILFFDGFCHLCNGFIDFLVKLDHQHKIYYASLQGLTAKKILTATQIENLNSVLYYKDGKILEKSTAIIEVLSDASIWFKWIKIFYIIPKFMRNFIYDTIATNRYKLFGKKDFCRIPTAEEKKYLLD